MPLDSAPQSNRRGWDGMAWDAAVVAILASGESLSVEQCEAVHVWRDRAPDSHKVIAINTTFRRALWADALYACDKSWWDGRDRNDMPTYYAEARTSFAGQLWTQDIEAAVKPGMHLIKSRPGEGLSRDRFLINQGMNSGHQAIGLAYWSGAAQVYLLGYDMHGGHWHGEHPAMLRRNHSFELFLRGLGRMAADVAACGDFSVVNCTPKSALTAFPMADWRVVFA